MLRFFVKVAIVFFIGLLIYWWVHPEERPDVDLAGIPSFSYEDIKNSLVNAVANEVGSVVSETIENQLNPDDQAVSEEESVIEEPLIVGEDVLPIAVQLEVPFTSQAPTGDWGLPYQEACEETAAYMVAMYYAGIEDGEIESEIANNALLSAIQHETEFLGFYFDTTAEETARWMAEYFDLNVVVRDNPTVDEIREEIAAGHPVIIPTAGRKLGNPFFSGEGPLYHFLVVKGYTEDSFITNDAGTKYGQNYVYPFEVVMEAMGDWNGGDPANGAKRIIIATPKE
ncbi:MAG: C39 family peptidase [Patescibacteria group bacterium]|jgi:hypothetical protein